MEDKDTPSRRRFLQTAGYGISALTLGVSTVSGRPQKEGEEIPDFDPTEKSEIRRASRVARKIETRGRFQRQWVQLSERQQDALVEANEVETVEVTVEETTDPESRDTDGSEVSGDDIGTDTHTSSSKEVYVTSTAKNAFGQLLAKFRHEVYWEFNYSEVTFLDAQHEGTTHWPFWSFAGLSSKSRRISGCAAESTRVGKFNYSVTEYGLIQQKNMGSEIDVQCDGAWTYRKIA